MISRERIRELSKLSGLRPWQLERHYLQGLLLSIISDIPVVFKGGTYLWFFHGLPRFSEDLDFTLHGTVRKNLLESISKGLYFYGFANELKILKNDHNGISARYMINGPLHTSEKDRSPIYLEISKREEVVLPKLALRLDFPQYDFPVKNILGMNLEEVASEKVRAILTREKGRDIFDLNFLIEKKEVKFNERLINMKLSFYDFKFERIEFLLKLEQMEKVYYREAKPIVLEELPDFKSAHKRIENWIGIKSQSESV